MTITAKNIGRINVWPTYAIAREADTGESKFTGQLTVWRTNEEALANTSYEEEGGGGGGVPAWVPANAVIHIDLVGGDPQGRAWVQGTGEVAVDTLLGEDENTSNYWDVSEYDPAKLNATGYSPDDVVAFIGEARTALVSGATLRLVIGCRGGDDSQTSVFYTSSNGEVVIGVVGYENNGNFDVDDANGNVSYPAILNLGNGTYNCFAVTRAGDRVEVAVNGVLRLADGSSAGAFTEDVLTTVFVIAASTIPSALQYITLYDPYPSTAGLAVLSEF